MKKLLIIFAFLPLVGVGQEIHNLVFEGAGIRGIAYCGALMEMEKDGKMTEVQRVAGTSSGAITASLISVGYTADEIYEVIGETNFGKFNDGGWFFIGGFHRLKKKLGYYKGDRFTHWLEDLIEEKTGSKDITFLQLYQKHQSDSKYKELVMTATSLNHQDAIIFSHHNYPNMRIVDAVRASMAIPYYFEPMIIDSVGHPIELDQLTATGDVCVDGGFTTNFPIYIFDDAPYFDSNTLGFRIDNDEQIASDKGSKEIVDQQVASLQDFSVAFYYLIKETMNRYMLTDEDWARTVSVSDADIGPKVKKLSEEEKQKLIQSGANAYLQFK